MDKQLPVCRSCGDRDRWRRSSEFRGRQNERTRCVHGAHSFPVQINFRQTKLTFPLPVDNIIKRVFNIIKFTWVLFLTTVESITKWLNSVCREYIDISTVLRIERCMLTREVKKVLLIEICLHLIMANDCKKYNFKFNNWMFNNEMNQFSWCWSRTDPLFWLSRRETCRPARASMCTTRSRWSWTDLLNLDWTGSVRRTRTQTESAADEPDTAWIPSLPETASPGLIIHRG